MQKLQESCDGMIHEKLDIKILILYILSKLPAPVDMSTLADLCRSDEDIGYFDFADCLSELQDSGNIEKTEDGYAVTEKGRRNAVEVSGSLPYSVRKNADKATAPVEKMLSRLNMIKCSHRETDGGLKVSLSMADGVGEMFSVNLLCPDEERARLMEKNFRANAEEYYRRITEMLLEKKKGK